MSDERSFERFVADHVAGAAGQIRMPDDFFDDIHAFASRTRQRPAWLALVKEPPMRLGPVIAVGSPTARVVVFVATTLLVALLGAGALVAGAQSPSPAPPVVPLSFFSGTQGEAAGGACQLADPPSEVVDGVSRTRGVSWGCQTVTADDPRLSGTTKYIWNSDASSGLGANHEIALVRQRIENEAGAWEGTLTELQFGSVFHEASGWLIGEGAYEGLTAYVTTDNDRNKIWGVIRPIDGFEAPAGFPDQ
jgi:hypothetical protein